MNQQQSMIRQLEGLRIVICGGAGGVGKTTSSAALGVALAHQSPVKVLILTIDPARRLAQALGIDHLGSDPTSLTKQLRQQGAEIKGQVSAAMLDVHDAWDRTLERYARSPEEANRLKQNPFYRSMTESFVGAQEYAALEVLYRLYAANEFDVIIIDTPPSTNAFDLLNAPKAFGDFLGARLMSLFSSPIRAGWRVFNFAAQPVTKLAARLLGTNSLEDLMELIDGFQAMYPGVQERAQAISGLLESDKTGFVVVTTLEPQQFAEAEYFCYRLRELNMHLKGIVVNRVLPPDLRQDVLGKAVRILQDQQGKARQLTDGQDHVEKPVVAVTTMLSLLYERAVIEQHLTRKLSRFGKAPLVQIPLLPQDLSNLAGVITLASALAPQAGGGATQ